MVEQTLPKVGDKLWYRLRSNREWLPAVVVNKTPEGATLEPPLDESQLHLLVTVDRRKHFAATTKALRLNVNGGTEPGQWSATKPKDADEIFEREQQTNEIRQEIMTAIMKGEEPSAVVESQSKRTRSK